MNRTPPSRRGFTLIELLVVITIVGLLAATVLTGMRPALEQRRMREAARNFTTMLYQAKARALETGRPCGIWMERDMDPNGQANIVRRISYAETPGVYTGDSDDARATFMEQGRARLVGANSDMVQTGDYIRFNFQDPVFQITQGGETIQFALPPEWQNPTSQSGLMPKSIGDNPQAVGVPFQIFRKPRISARKTLVMPGDVIIDLGNSGYGDNGKLSLQAAKQPLIVLFSPNGGIDRLFEGEKALDRPINVLHFLVGKRAKAGGENLKEPLNLWVSISNQTGVIYTSPITVQEGGGGLQQARELARNPATGGRM